MKDNCLEKHLKFSTQSKASDIFCLLLGMRYIKINVP